MIRPGIYGPLSLMRILSDLPFFRLVTFTLQGSVSVLCAPEMCHGMTFSSIAVSPRLKPKNELSSYQDTIPRPIRRSPSQRI